MLEQITPLILTLDEEPNLGRVLERLAWARDIVIVDSFSRDATCEIAGSFPNTRLFQRKFDLHANQWNFGLTRTGISTEWVLALDSDYIVPEELLLELKSLSPKPEIAGYRASFIYCVDGRPLRNTAYTPVTVLFRRSKAGYAQDGHTQRVRVDGLIETLTNRIQHDDRKPWERWFRSQQRYMQLESAKLRATPFSQLRWQDKIRRLVVVAPPAMLVYCLIAKGNLLDGRAGLKYAAQRALAECILSMHLLRALFQEPSTA